MNSKWARFKEELRIIPSFANVLSAIAFVCPPAVFAAMSRIPNKVPPFPWWLVLSILCGAVLAAWVLVIGYINADAGRRGMGRVLWTLIAIFVPNCLGILLYFLLRTPMLRQCAGCGAMVDPAFQFCHKCGLAMWPACASCGRGIDHEFVCCPYCGKPVKTPEPTSPGTTSELA